MRRGQPRRWALYPYTDRELAVIELRAHGVSPAETARRLGLTVRAVYNRLWRVYQKAGVTNAADMTEWAIRHAMDIHIEPEAPAPRVPKKRGRKRIKMRRSLR